MTAQFPSFSPDGQTIAFFLYNLGTMDLWTVGKDGANAARGHEGSSRPKRTTNARSRATPRAGRPMEVALRSPTATTPACS